MGEKNESGLHKGHRERLRRRFIESGIAGLYDHEILELLLTYCIPRRDVNPLAHRLIDRYGSLNEVFEADLRSLCAEYGLSENSAVLLKLIESIRALPRKDADQCGARLVNVSQAAEFCRTRLNKNEWESSLAIFLNKQNRVVDSFALPGDAEHVALNKRMLITSAVSGRVASVVLAHVHPSGACGASEADKAAINKLSDMLGDVGVRLSEVFIITGDRIYAALHNVMLDIGEPSRCADELPLAVGSRRLRRTKPDPAENGATRE